MQNYNLPTINEGNTFPGVAFELPNLAIYDLTQAKVILAIGKGVKAAIVATLSSEGVAPAIEITGAYTFEIKEGDLDIVAGTYNYDILIVFQSGLQKTFIGGHLQIDPVYSKY